MTTKKRLKDPAEGNCSRVYTDKGVSGTKASRPEWDKCLERLEKGDVLIVTRMDLMGRSTRNLLDVVDILRERGVDLVILDQAIDTMSAIGRCFFTIMTAFAEFEREVIVERTMDGLANARAQGRVPTDRKRKYTDGQAALAKTLKSQGQRLRRSLRRSGYRVRPSTACSRRHKATNSN